MTTSNSFDWNDDVVERLRQFWADGHSTAEIGRRFGISKNAVVGYSCQWLDASRRSGTNRLARSADG